MVLHGVLLVAVLVRANDVRALLCIAVKERRTK